MKNKNIKFRKKTISRLITLILINMLIALPAMTQDKLDLNIASNTDMTFDGTSNVHDWSCEVTEIKGKGAFARALLNGSEYPNNAIQNVKISIPVKSIKSGKGKMNDIMYDALKEEEYPNIEYELISSEIIGQTGDEFTVQTSGNLTIAGVTREISLQVEGKKINEEAVKFTGAKNLKMTQFNIEPPKALFGAIRSGDQVDVQFTAVFEE